MGLSVLIWFTCLELGLGGFIGPNLVYLSRTRVRWVYRSLAGLPSRTSLGGCKGANLVYRSKSGL